MYQHFSFIFFFFFFLVANAHNWLWISISSAILLFISNSTETRLLIQKSKALKYSLWHIGTKLNCRWDQRPYSTKHLLISLSSSYIWILAELRGRLNRFSNDLSEFSRNFESRDPFNAADQCRETSQPLTPTTDSINGRRKPPFF